MGKSAKSDKDKVSGIAHFFEGVKTEFGKISWPDKDSLLRQSTAVLVVSVIVGVIISVLDLLFQYGFNFITSL